MTLVLPAQAALRSVATGESKFRKEWTRNDTPSCPSRRFSLRPQRGHPSSSPHSVDGLGGWGVHWLNRRFLWNVLCGSGNMSQTTTLSSSNAWANQWPSTDTVSGLGGTLSSISVTLYDWSASFDTTNLEYLLVAPDGTAYEFLQTYDCNDFGDGVKDTASTITISDSGSAFPTSGDCSSLGGGTYKPTVVAVGGHLPQDCEQRRNAGSDCWEQRLQLLGPGAGQSAPATLNGTFGNISPNGTWGLYLENGFPADCDAGGCESSSLGSATDSPWSLNITTTGATNDSTTTSLTSDNNPSFTSDPGKAVNLTATVSDSTSSGTSVNSGTVAFTDGGASLSCGSVPVSSSGTATCSTSFSSEGSHAIKAAYSGGGTFNPSSDTLTQTVYAQTNVSNTTYCNNAGLTIPASGSNGSAPFGANPYPSKVFVGSGGGIPSNGDTNGLGGTIQNVSLQLENLTFNNPDFVGFMLVSPTGTAYDLMSYAGGSSQINGVNLNLEDGQTLLPKTTVSTGNYSPASYVYAGSDTWTGSAPSTFDSATPRGSATFASEFGGQDPNGAWSLYAEARGGGFSGSLGDWCLNFTTASGAATSTAVTTDTPNATTGATVNLTATVIDTPSPTTAVNAGTVDFRSDGTTITGCNAVSVSSGSAVCSTSALPEGIHTIEADYSGSPGNFGVSHGSTTQEVDNKTTETISGNTYTYCNPNTGGIQIPNANQVQGAAYPYPSNINVTDLPGTINHMSISINGFTTNAPDYLRSLVVGPDQTAGDSLDFFSNVSSTSAVSNQNLTFADSASSNINTPTSGTYKPTSANGTSDVFPSPAPQGSYNYAGSAGSSTLGSVFGSGSNEHLDRKRQVELLLR